MDLLEKIKELGDIHGIDFIGVAGIRHMKKIIDQRCDVYLVPDKEVIYAHSGPISLNC